MPQVSFDFTGKNVVVTGASGGIGQQIVRELTASGAHVLALARNIKSLESIQEACPANITIAACDVTIPAALEDSIHTFVSKQGKLHASVHVAGTIGLTPLKMYDPAEARCIMETNFWAGIELVRLATMNKYAEHGSAHVLFSSVSAYSGEKGLFAYSASKAALLTAVKSLSKEIAIKGHRIMSISPGWINTALSEKLAAPDNQDSMAKKHLLGYGQPQDVSGMVLFLLSDRARWITGTDFIVDGGFLA